MIDAKEIKSKDGKVCSDCGSDENLVVSGITKEGFVYRCRKCSRIRKQSDDDYA